MVDEQALRSGTASGMLAFLDHLIDKRRASAGTVKPLRSASRKILTTLEGENWESLDVRSLDVDDSLERFANKTVGTYTAESLRAYDSRFRRAVEWYRAFLDKPGWTPPATSSRTPSGTGRGPSATNQPRKAGDGDQAEDPSEREEAARSDPPARTRSLLTFPFPLRSGEIAYLQLPAQLARPDAARLSAFLDSLVLDEHDETS